MKFQKKPVVIDAEQWTNQGDSLQRILDLGCSPSFAADGTPDLIISTMEGDMRASLNDWIIKGVKGEFYPCKPDIFEATYTPPAPATDAGDPVQQ